MRCIDADALERKISISHSMTDDYGVQAGYAISMKLIEDAPTIEPQRKKGHWILVKGSNGKDYHKCSKCLHTQEITGVKNYCAVCGADMGVTNETV